MQRPSLEPRGARPARAGSGAIAVKYQNPYYLIARLREEAMAERAKKAHEADMSRQPIACPNCGGHAPGPWLIQWRAEHPRSRREACVLKRECLYATISADSDRKALWDGDESVLLTAPLVPR